MSIRIALAGNPNSGKSTLFNALTGSNQYVGNWPGVTVEKKEGKLKGHSDIVVTDLPGIYSLSPYTLEEVVARNYLIQELPDAILNIVDATNLERNLYLTTQLVELGIPVVIALNMMDIIQKNGDTINVKELEKSLGCKIVQISALKGTGIDEAVNAVIDAAKNTKTVPKHSFSGPVEHAIAHIEEATEGKFPEAQQHWYAIKIFERDDRVVNQLNLSPEVKEHIEADIVAAEKELDDDAESLITNDRYNYIGEILKGSYKKKKAGELTLSDKIDRIVTNRVLALPIFVVVMFIVYYVSVTTVGTIVTDWTNDVFVGEFLQGNIAAFLENMGVAGWLSSLIVDGIVGGVGAVLGFVPQILVLFFFLAFLEGCGYMARIAFIMDRLFRRFGLSGKSFIPMMIGTGCGIPGVMASRTIENERDRRMTIMTTTFIPCGAKLPIIALIAGAFFPGREAIVSTSAYFIGVAAIIISGIMLKKTKMFAGDPAPFVMELPAYHLPTLGSILRSMWERGWSFIKKAGTIILLSTIVIWFLQSFSFTGGFHMIEDVVAENDTSILARIGQAIGWIFWPLGWNVNGEGWKAAVAAVTGLVAKENVVATYGVLYGFEEVAEAGDEIWGSFAASFGRSGLIAYSFLVFNLLCAPCFAAIGAIRREMNNAKWTWFAICYQCLFAYAVSLIIYQVGSALTGQIHPIGLIAALIVLAAIIYQLFKPYKESQKFTSAVKVAKA
ncbi:MAG: ferrous iron transport protein B [Lachnospiraceae bacterium]|nr:ferrous iron transport protein B [Lachnospiraceae bacterium]